MIDVHETMRAMRELWRQELNETGRAVTLRMFFEVHPETHHAICAALEPWTAARLIVAGELALDGIPVRRSLALRPGLVRLIIAARETEIVLVPEAFDDESDRRRAR